MKNVTFANKGLIDLRAIKTFGVNSKETKHPIGQFGTGSKYAIAILLRNGCTIDMYIGLNRYTFEATKTRIRVDDFDIVTLWDHTNGSREELAFTTDLGRNWKPWQAMRELWSNALDEGGNMYAGALEPEEDVTTFVVAGQAMVDAYYEREKVMLIGDPKWSLGGVDIHYKRSSHSYFRGIRVGDLTPASRLTYNIVGHAMALTEDRTLQHPHMIPYHVRNAIVNSDSEDLLQEVIEAPRESFEGQLDFGDEDPGPLLMRMLEDVDFRAISNPTLLMMYRKKKGLAIRPADITLDENEEKVLKRSIEFCEAIGYQVADFAIHITDDLPDHVMGRAYDGAIFINRRTFMRGTKMVTGTILEEYIHLRHRLNDESRAFQDYLIDAVVTIGEKLLGEPL